MPTERTGTTDIIEWGSYHDHGQNKDNDVGKVTFKIGNEKERAKKKEECLITA